MYVTITIGSETWSLTVGLIRKLKVGEGYLKCFSMRSIQKMRRSVEKPVTDIAQRIGKVKEVTMGNTWREELMVAGAEKF